MTDLPPPAPTPPAVTASVSFTRNQIIALAAGAIVILGSFLPWAKVLFFTLNGTDGDGVITLILGALAVGGVLLKKKWSILVAMLLFVVTAIIGIYDFAYAVKKSVETDISWKKYFIEAFLFSIVVYWIYCYAMSRYSQWLEREFAQGRSR